MNEFKIPIILALSFIAVTILFENNKSIILENEPKVEIQKNTNNENKLQDLDSVTLITQEEKFFNVATLVDTKKLDSDEPKKGNIAIIPQDNEIEFSTQKVEPIKKLEQQDVDRIMKKYISLADDDNLENQKKAKELLKDLKGRYVLDELSGIINETH